MENFDWRFILFLDTYLMEQNTLKNNCFNSRSNINFNDSQNKSSEKFLNDFNSSNHQDVYKLISEQHENSWQTAILYISIILSIYFITILFIAIKYILNRNYGKPLFLLYQCCSCNCREKALTKEVRIHVFI